MSDYPDPYRQEPDITMVDHDAAIVSIAISLKRIADALEGRNQINKKTMQILKNLELLLRKQPR